MTELYIGLMSGTSADGIDAALVDFSGAIPRLIATRFSSHSVALREKIHSLSKDGTNEIQLLGELDHLLGKAFAKTTNDLLKDQEVEAATIAAIGSHGQTVRHHPHHPHAFTLQIGDPNIIATETNITTVADFRRRDMALGGQGAPLVPAFHQAIFASTDTNRIIVNIGGIANITLLPKTAVHTLGFDTGPGNVLLDGWIYKHQGLSHDEQGAWAQQGKIQLALLQLLLSDPYFKLAPPKSTGREYFNLAWLEHYLSQLAPIAAVDVQATLTELTAQSILQAIQHHLPDGEILVCGGGAHNTFLMQRLQTLSQSRFAVASTKKYDIDPDWMEAIAFAWLARQTMHKKPGNLPHVTGAKQAAILGGIYYAT